MHLPCFQVSLSATVAIETQAYANWYSPVPLPIAHLVLASIGLISSSLNMRASGQHRSTYDGNPACQPLELHQHP